MDPYTVSPERFTEQMAQIRVAGWRVAALADVLVAASAWPANTVVLTFDDGFASNRDYAWPVLTQFQFPATTFLVAKRLGGTNSWDIPAKPRYPLLGTGDLRDVRPELMSFQSHGATHVNLAAADQREAANELADSRVILEHILGRPVTLFAYPFGSWDWRIAECVRAAGYRAACSCVGGLNTARTNRLVLRRVEVHEQDGGWRFHLKLRTGRDLTTWPPGELEFVRAAIRSHSQRL